jgi:hypothetical protein
MSQVHPIERDTMAVSKGIPSFTDAAKAAGVPLNIKTEDVHELGTVTWLEKEELTSTLPDGSPSEGYFCKIADADGSLYTVFIGGVALVKMLKDIPLPFAASIGKSGRTWVFED